MSEEKQFMNKDVEEEKRFFVRSLSYGLVIVCLIWFVKLFEIIIGAKLSFLGVYPQSLKGLPGIFFSPLIHGDFSHLISNTLPIFILTAMLFYFYNRIGLRVLVLIWLIGNIWLWVIGRESYHIGASGVIYGMAAFLFVSGIIRRHHRLMAISLLIAFLYGGMIWGILPIREGVSWEGHLTGMLAGIVLAFFYRKEGPQRKLYDWELEDDENDEDELIEGKTLEEWDEYFDRQTEKRRKKPKPGTKVKYIYKPKKDSEE